MWERSGKERKRGEKRGNQESSEKENDIGGCGGEGREERAGVELREPRQHTNPNQDYLELGKKKDSL